MSPRSTTGRVIVCALAFAVTSAANAADAAAAKAKEARTEASIAFANHGGISNWSVLDSKTLLIEDNHHRWYRAELFSSAFDLPFAEALAFKTTPSGTLDRFSTVIVKGRAYPIVSLTRAGPPAKQKK